MYHIIVLETKSALPYFMLLRVQHLLILHDFSVKKDDSLLIIINVNCYCHDFLSKYDQWNNCPVGVI